MVFDFFPIIGKTTITTTTITTKTTTTTTTTTLLDHGAEKGSEIASISCCYRCHLGRLLPSTQVHKPHFNPRPIFVPERAREREKR